ncbi:hypothetical protein [Dysosmobacter sp.]|uniref:hypothetical protein n=1 Tax=Dysosmobacter sp. TaxID=2591382 RepID=UPI003FD8E0F0
MRNDRFSVQVETRGPKLVMTFDEVKERPSDLTFEVVKEKPHADADISRKLDKILDALEREIKGDRPTPQQSLEAAIAEIMEKYEGDARRQGINPSPEAPGMDYAAMNPHKRSPVVECSDRPHIRKNGRFGYENSEDRVTVPARFFEDSGPMTPCEEAEAAYAAMNPHKCRDKQPATRTARDSARRPMSICEQCEAAYAARNPHKRRI